MYELAAKLEAEERAERTARPAASSPSSPPPCFTAPAPVVRRVVAQVCICAVYDREFLDRYERQASGLYFPVESRRIEGGTGSGAGAEIGRVLNVDQIRGAYKPCPWCGENGNMRYHCDCGGVICGGKVKGKTFHCRASCGRRWPMGDPVHEIEVTEEQARREWKTPPRPGSTWKAPAATNDNPARLLLPPARRK
jgi:hypothetical protein